MNFVSTAILVALSFTVVGAAQDVEAIDIRLDELKQLGLKVVASGLSSAEFGEGYRVRFLGEAISGETEIYQISIELRLEGKTAIIPVELSWVENGSYSSGDMFLTLNLISEVTVIFSERLIVGTTIGRDYRLNLGDALATVRTGLTGN